MFIRVVLTLPSAGFLLHRRLDDDRRLLGADALRQWRHRDVVSGGGGVVYLHLVLSVDRYRLKGRSRGEGWCSGRGGHGMV